jgi:hypothetical protein
LEKVPILEQLKKASTEWQRHFDVERQIGLYADWVGKWRSPCNLPKELFSSFPFDSDYWITSTRLSALNVKSLISDVAAKPT